MKDIYSYNENVGTEEIEMSIEDARELGVVPEIDSFNDDFKN